MTASEQAKAYALQKLGLDWAKLEKWTDKNRAAYLGAIAEFRQSNPHLFTAAELEAATNYALAASSPAPEFSYVDEFIKEAGAQISSLNDDLNPFAETNRAKTRNTIIGAVLIAAAVFAGIWAWRTSPRNPNQRPPGGDDLFRDKPKRARKK